MRNFRLLFIVTNMKTPNDFNIQTVYSYDSSDDLKNYYNDWAHEYDDYTNDVNYILPESVVKIFCNYPLKEKATVLDIGCGTGLVGLCLANKQKKIWIEGIDISRSMAHIAATKRKPNFKPVYDWIIIEDFKTNKLLLENHYDAIVSAGTFTTGHLDCDDLFNSIKYLKKDGLVVVSIKEDHYIDDSFNKKIFEAQKNNLIQNVETFKVNSYNSDFDAKSMIVKFNKV